VTTERSVPELFAHRFEPDARAEIARRYDYLAQQLARKFRDRGIPLDDLIQVARFGLVNAIDRFDTDRGVRFSTFAGRTIVGEIKHHFRGHAWSLRVPRSLQNLFLRTSDAVQVLSQRLGRSPTIAELAEHLDVDEDEVLEALDAGGTMHATSLDRPIHKGESTPIVDTVGTSDRALQRAAAWAELAPVIAALDERERTILFMRFYEGRTQQEIADEVGVSQVHVSRLLRRTLAHIRGQIVDEAS
jgi:RNA polymerase sigma-B factor